MKIEDVWVRVLLLILAVGGVLAGVLSPSGSAPSVADVPDLVETFAESAVFHMRYPEHWMYQVGQGLLVFGEAEGIFRARPGPSITVFRTEALIDPDLRSKLDTYLERGPLRSGHFARTAEVTEITFAGRRALQTEVEGRNVDDETAPVMRSYLILTLADNGVAYIISADAPAEQWAAHWPLFQAMLDTAEIRE
ncbi:MAG: hypothetical protein Kow00120_07620 [Anaerolineae bacterium]